jgi:hypothetical protein
LSWPLVAAAAIMAGGCVFHASLTRRLIGPLVADRRLPEPTRRLGEMCWHAVSVVFAVLAAAFAAGAAGLLHADAMRLGGVLALSIAVLAGALTARAGLPPWRHPASYLLPFAAALAWWGSASG